MKTILAYFGILYLLLVFVRLITVLLNIASRPFLKMPQVAISEFKLSVLIPARNEEKNLAGVLEKLLKQTVLPTEIIVYNDNSTDNTLLEATKMAQQNPGIKVINGSQLPNGWLGKNHACYQMAQVASGNYFLFLDADVLPLPTMIEKSLSRMDEKKLDLLSLFPRQHMETIGEQLVVPLMHNILLSLLPLFYVRSSNRVSFAAANGQFMLFNANAYKKIQPHAWVKQKAVEDIEIVRLYKKFHYKCETLLGNHAVSCRMYNSFNESVNGFSKNIQSFFGNSRLAMLLYTFLTVFGFGGVLFLPGKLIVWCIIALLLYHTLLHALSGRNFWMVLLVPAQTAITFFIAIRSIIYRKKGLLQWKGRQIKV